MESKDVPRSRQRVLNCLDQLENTVKSCVSCRLHIARTNTVFARGNPHAELLFLGEGPGAQEDEAGVPFVGPSGRMVDKMIASIGYARDDVYVCNVVKCRPPENRKPEDDEIGACWKYLEQQLVLVAPRVIIALGTTAAQALHILRSKGKMNTVRGKWQKWRDADVMVTYHPAYLFHKPQMKAVVWTDTQAVAAKLGKETKIGVWQ